MATKTIQPWFPMLHQTPPPPRWTNLLFMWLMCLSTVHAHRLEFEVSPSDHYWRRYEVGQWLVFGWFGSWGTLDTQLAWRKLGKNNIPQSWRPPSPYGSHGALLPAPPHTAISQHVAQQVYVVKTRKYYCFNYLLAILRHNTLLTCRACVFEDCLSGRCWDYHSLSGRRWEYDALSMHWEYGYSQHRPVPVCLRVASVDGAEIIILSAGGAESMMPSACAESMDTLSTGAESIILSVPPTESMIHSVLFCRVITLTS